jgi:uncharacterized membrane protein YcaP (DUF421 family)
VNENGNPSQNYLNIMNEREYLMDEFFQTILRTTFSSILLLVVTYFFGKRMTTHRNYHNFAIAITIGSYIANMGFDTNLRFGPTLASFFTLAFIFLFSSYLSFKKVNLRKYLAGQPLIIIEKGQMNEDHMSKARYTMDDLQQQLREQGTFHVEEIETAILEVSGKLSIQPKEKYTPVVKQDLEQLFQPSALELIIDGKMVLENLTSVHHRDWVQKQCQARNVKIEQVSYAVVGSNGVFYLIKYTQD